MIPGYRSRWAAECRQERPIQSARGKRIAVVHDLPGVTRDRHYARSLVHGRPVTIVDTGGLDPTTDDPLNPNVIAQAELAIGRHRLSFASWMARSAQRAPIVTS